MNLLAIDASSENISLCIKYRTRIIAKVNQRKLFGASLLIGYIEKYLQKSSLSLKAIDAFVVGSGPGSFTGLRISFSVIKAFMLALGKPAIAISSFLSCAYAVRRSDKPIAVISDARRGLIYSACFKPKGGIVQRTEKEKLSNLEEFISQKSDHLFVSYNLDLRRKALAYDSNINFYSKNIYPQANNLLAFAQRCYNQKKFTALEKLKPLYLHPKTCQVRKVL